MKWQESDKVSIDNLVRIIKRGNYSFTGMEALAFSDACKWLNGLAERVEKRLADKPMAIKPIKKAVKHG